MRPLSRQAANLSFLRRLLLSALRLLRHLRIPPFTGGLRGRPAASALCRLARRPGVAATSLRGLTRAHDARRASSNLRRWEKPGDKKMGCSASTPKVKAENYRFFAAFFFPPLAAFFAIFFSSGCCDPASDEPLGRHYWWAEPSTLIPDVDYG